MVLRVLRQAIGIAGALAIPVGTAWATSSDSLIACKEAAGAPSEPDSGGQGRPLNAIDTKLAIGVCLDALKQFPGSAETKYRLARAHIAAQNFAEAFALNLEAATAGYAPAQNNLGFAYQTGSGVAQDLAKAVHWYGLSAKQNYAPAQDNLGLMYVEGQGVERNLSEAAGLFQSAADQGLDSAQNNLGVMHRDGLGTAPNDSKAVHWFRLAAEQGLADAQNNLGHMYLNGRGVAQAPVVAARWFQLAADQGHADAQGALGSMYLNGQGVRKDEVLALQWLEKGADAGNIDAQALLGWMLANGRGVRANQERASALYLEAANGGNAWAQWQIGERLIAGTGVSPDREAGLVWLRKAAEAGQTEALKSLAVHDPTGTTKSAAVGARYPAARLAYDRGDFSTAVKELRPEAEAGHAPSQELLALMYAEGQGVEKDDTESVTWLQKAAAQGMANSQFRLALNYIDGKGVAKDLEAAEHWLNQAASRGVERARKVLEHVAEMKKNEKDAAHELAKMDPKVREAIETVTKIDKKMSDLKKEQKDLISENETLSNELDELYKKKDELDKGVYNDTLKLYRLAMRTYAEGLGDMGADISKDAFSSWHELGKENHAPSQLMVGVLYARGHGVTRDLAQAREWLTRAAENGNAAAQYNLSVLLFQANELGRAYMWISIADKLAIHVVTRAAVEKFKAFLEQSSDKGELSQGTKLANEWIASNKPARSANLPGDADGLLDTSSIHAAQDSCGDRVCRKTADGRTIYQTENKKYWYYADGRIAPKNLWPSL